jgi:hypothetical protein
MTGPDLHSLVPLAVAPRPSLNGVSVGWWPVRDHPPLAPLPRYGTVRCGGRIPLVHPEVCWS